MTKKSVLAITILTLVVFSLVLGTKVTLAQSTIYVYANDTGVFTSALAD
jgi:hypothetical protein